MSSEVTILTHGDLDGMVCGILLLRAVSREADLRITNGEKFAKEMDVLAGTCPPPKDIFITDIPLLPNATVGVIECVASLKHHESRVHVYDHHHGWDAVRDRGLFDTFVIDVDKTTAAAIVWRELLRGDVLSQRWLQLLSEKNQSKDLEIVRDFGVLAALAQPMYWKHTEEVLRMLASGAKLLPEQEALSSWYYNCHVPKEREIAANAEIVTTAGGRRLAWIDLRGYRERFNVARHAVEMHGADVVATVIERAVLLGGRSIDQGVDLTFLHGEHTLGNEKIKIAGHKSPVRISPVGSGLTASLVNAIRQFILDSL